MNKNLKRTMALALAVGTVSAVAPAMNGNILTTTVYAATDDENTDESLDSLQLESSSGATIKLYSESDYDSDSKLAKDDTPDEDTYYAKSSYSKVNLNIDGPKSKYVKVFKSTSSSPSDSTRGKSISDDITLSSGTNYLTVRVYNNEPDSSVRYDDGDVASEYVIKVKYSGTDSDSDSSSDEADDYDDIYLDKLTVDAENITLSDSKVAYSFNVANSASEVTVKAVPNDEDEDTITIDGTEVDDSDSYKKKVSLNVGANKIEIKTENEDSDERIYTLTINRAAAAVVNTATTQPSTATGTVTKTIGWSVVSGKWQYFDSLGNALKNQWFNDKGYGKWYFLDAYGNMQTGWIFNNGKYYYLNSDGSMAANTTINGYKLGPNGDWIY